MLCQCRYIRCTAGLLDKLLESGLLSRDQVSAVARESTVYRRSDRMAAYLISMPYQQLLAVVVALSCTAQQHIINFISPETGTLLTAL